MRVRIAAAAAALALASVFAAGQQPTPTFRTEVNYVQLPVRVLDSKGSFVRDLKQEDVQVYEDGQIQSISTFRLIDFPLPGAKSTAATSSVAPGLMTIEKLEQLDGRVYMFLLDDYHVGVQYSPRAKEIVRSFIRDRMAANDVAAVMITSGAKGQDFTTDKRLLLAAIDRFTGVLDSEEPVSVEEIKARSVVKMMTDIAGALGQIRGRHKTMIYVGTTVGCRVSQQMAADAEAALQTFAPGKSGLVTSPREASAGILCSEPTWDAVRAAVQGDVTIYSIDPRGNFVSGFVSPAIDGRGGPGPARERMRVNEPGVPSVFDAFRIVADSTGGFVVTGTNAFNQALDRIFRESSSYYLLGYSSTNEKPDGKFRKTEIRLTRQGLQVFYRPGYLARRP
jgi:VWFA-related protein